MDLESFVLIVTAIIAFCVLVNIKTLYQTLFPPPPPLSPSFCVLPWIQIILGPDDPIKLCCIAKTPLKNAKGKVYALSKTRLEDYWNSYGLRQIRKKMLSGEKVKSCENCYYQESLGRTSHRQAFNKKWLQKDRKEILKRIAESNTNGFRVEGQPLYLDIRPGNHCNLKCRMCHPENSSKIYQEQKELLKENFSEISPLIDTSYFKRNGGRLYNWHKNKKIWKTLFTWGPGIKQLYFTGGEPTLIKENWWFINYLIEKGYSKNIDLSFSINCTNIPQKLLDTFKAFSEVTVMLSVDGYEKAQEYIRYPSKWIEVKDNIEKLLKNRTFNTIFCFSPVVQIYNIFNLPFLLSWIDDLQIKYGAIKTQLIICRNGFLDIAILPKSIKQEALFRVERYESFYSGKDVFLLECLNQLKNILKMEEKEGIEEPLKSFYKYTTILDQKRNNNFKKTFPELNAFLNKDGRWKNARGGGGKERSFFI